MATVLQNELDAWREAHPDADEAYLDDVRLAIACARASPEALTEFDARLKPAIEAAVRRLGTGDFVDELMQLVRERLLVGTRDGPPRIREYAGRGSLEKFVQAVALRTALNLREQRQRLHAHDADDALFDLPAADHDPELALLKTKYRTDFKAAFSAALAELEPESRNALRQYYLDALSLAELGKLYGWSIATASRRVAAARIALLEGTRRHLAGRLQISSHEVDSVLRLIESQLSVEGLR